MKLILPILICSAISAALGYYFGHITLPVDSQPVAAPATISHSAPALAPAPPAATQPVYAETEPANELEPMPDLEPVAAPDPEPAPEPEADLVENTTAPQTNFAERAAQTTQTLTDTQGRTIEARIVEVTEQNVTIRRTDGLETKIPLNMLSPEDVAFCNYLREQAAKKPAAKPASSDGFDWDAYFNS